MMELRKTCNHPWLITGGPEGPLPSDPQRIPELIAASGKLQLLDKMLLRLKEGGHRVLLYSQFTRTLDLLEEWMMGRGWGYLRIDGEPGGVCGEAGL
jgi:chromodomain-helicase-DNA-binding protein 4